MSKKPAAVTRGQAALLICCIALAALLLTVSACVWLAVRARREQPETQTAQTADQTETQPRPADTIALGVWIGKVDVSGMTEEQALQALAEYEAALPDVPLNVRLPDRTLTFTGVRTASLSDPEAAVRQAMASTGGVVPLTLDYQLRANVIRDTIRAAAEAVSSAEGASNYRIEGKTLLFTPGEVGVRLDTQALYNAVVAAYSQTEVADFDFNYIEVSSALEELTLLKDELTTQPQNARYDPETTAISEAVPGLTPDLSAAKALLEAAEPGDTVRIPMVEVPADIDRATMQANLFRESLADWSSGYYYNPSRTNNLTLACRAVNGTVIQPGDTFSFNDVVGERTAARGYQSGTVYVGGVSAAELGGGVCQVASTIYCAALYANLEIVERTEHMYLVTYVPYGMDATVYWGEVDFVFRNSTDYPIKILANTDNGAVNVSLLGTDVTGETVQMDYLVLSVTPWEEEIREDETKPVGYYEELDASPYTGYRINTYRTVLDADGSKLSTVQEAQSIYAAANKIIIVGAGTDLSAADLENAETVEIGIPEDQLTDDGQPVTVTAEDDVLFTEG